MSLVRDCPFCKIQNQPEYLINESETFVSFLSNPRIRQGHALVVPKRHVEVPVDLQRDEILGIYGEVQRLQRRVIDNLAPGCDTWQKYQPFVPQGRVKVDHVHFHVIPRNPEDRLLMNPEESQFEAFIPLSAKEQKELLSLFRKN